jgi:tRNA threonylcarbamoyladenosine biosynthesis protein TsaB
MSRCVRMDRFMSERAFNLAIETSSRRGSIAFGCGDEMRATAELGRQRHGVELLPAVDRLCGEQGCRPSEIGEVYVSVGPGSFTGLRIAVTTAKMLAMAWEAKITAVPTLDVVIENAGHDAPPHVAVMLNAKRGQCFTGLYERREDRWMAEGEATLMTPGEVCQRYAEPFGVIGDHLPDHDWPQRAVLLDAGLATPRAEVAWRLGRSLAAAGQYIDAMELTPLYVRLPEAEEVWQAKQQAGGK